MRLLPILAPSRDRQKPQQYSYFGFVPALVLCFLIPPLAFVFTIFEDSGCCAFSSDRKPAWQTVLNIPKLGSEGKGQCDWSYGESSGSMAFISPGRLVVALHLECRSKNLYLPLPAHTSDILLQ